ncbi:hypothetical protein PV326_013277, partial [Microctonus aethiopoides]
DLNICINAVIRDDRLNQSFSSSYLDQKSLLNSLSVGEQAESPPLVMGPCSSYCAPRSSGRCTVHYCPTRLRGGRGSPWIYRAVHKRQKPVVIVFRCSEEQHQPRAVVQSRSRIPKPTTQPKEIQWSRSTVLSRTSSRNIHRIKPTVLLRTPSWNFIE